MAAPPPQLVRLWLAQARDYALLFLDEAGVVVAAAGAIDSTLGYSADEMIGHPLARLFTPEDLALGLDRHELIVAQTTGRAHDDRWHLRKDGTRIWVSGALTALHDDDGAPAGFAKIMRDRTDLRSEIESLRNRAAALLQIEQQTTTVLGTLAHELRNPLSPLTTAVQLIRRIVDDERLRMPLSIIDRQIAVLTRLVDDLMDATRIETGKLELHVEQINLQTALRRVVDARQGQAQERRITLETALPDAPITIEADPLRFEQIVVNLLNNALKYTPADGRVWVKASVETGHLVLRVEDTGVGIAADVLPRIFEMFTQDPAAKAFAVGGLGIGLALVKSLVQAHHGIVEVRSEGPGRGSEFTVRLPLRQPLV